MRVRLTIGSNYLHASVELAEVDSQQLASY